ncbi:inosine-uridine preferring nucleoside hydrolase-like isoform X3 [Octopus sinensis]|uniref:Inosine-uridine preferring nucleoside hydrolase-like isoform X3 n=1 Tax=Octopus sinensis TaxID=2607531 RepID=A0A7E6FLD6_9MOLL|nr:inosine-uridine preferring nucleoside hydrolase-like isoform X3 [Octopus sinensis]
MYVMCVIRLSTTYRICYPILLYIIFPSGCINKKIIIDTDPGIDDAQAILMALGKDSSVDVVAITTVQGNAPVMNTSLNTLRLLKVANRQDIPVFQGCKYPLMQRAQHAQYYHGKDGLGDVPDSEAPGLDHLQKEHAVNALIHLVNQNPGELHLVSLAPLTNIATAITLDPDFGSKLKSCYIMGGNYKGVGNISRSAEFNFYNDPEAASIVLKKLSCPITLITWELCEDLKQPSSFFEKLLIHPGKKTALMQKVFKNAMKQAEARQRYAVMCDELAMAAIVNDQCVLDSVELYAEVELNGSKTRGQMVPDWTNITGKPSNVQIVTKMDLNIVVDILKKCYDF